jgi:glyoxylase-like metal-dependent hydrolase (beta-lactamase superfamily II)
MTVRPAWSLDLGAGVRLAGLGGPIHRIDPGPMFGPVPRLLWSRAVGDELDAGDRIAFASQALLIETPHARLLVDPGPAGAGAPGAGRVDLILATSLRRWTVGVLTTEPVPAELAVVPVVAQAAEWAVAQRDNPRVDAAYDVVGLAGVVAAGRARSEDGDAAVVPGVEVLVAGGPSAGHQAVLVRGSDGRTFAWLGDLLMRPWQANPRWITAWDDLPLDSVRVKGELFARAVAEDWIVVCPRDPDAAPGRLVPDRDRYRFAGLA